MAIKKRGIIFVVIATLVLLMVGAAGLVGCSDSDSNSSSGSGGAGSGGSSNGGSSNGGSSDTYAEVEIAKLVADYETQAGMADELYKDKKIKIVGKVLSVEDLRMVLALPDGDDAVVVVYAATLASISGAAGDTVEVQGVCKGMGTGEDNGLVKLTDCIIAPKTTNPG